MRLVSWENYQIALSWCMLLNFSAAKLNPKPCICIAFREGAGRYHVINAECPLPNMKNGRALFTSSKAWPTKRASSQINCIISLLHSHGFTYGVEEYGRGREGKQVTSLKGRNPIMSVLFVFWTILPISSTAVVDVIRKIIPFYIVSEIKCSSDTKWSLRNPRKPLGFWE